MKYFDTKKDSLEEAISKAINEKPEQLKEARYEIKFGPNEYGQDDEDDYIDMLQGELEGKRIRVKVSPGSKNNTLSFDTNVPKAKLKKVIEDDLGYYVNESSEYYSNPNAKDLLEAGGKYLKYSDLLLQKGRLMQQKKNTAMIDKEISKEMKKLGIKEGSDEYEKFFQSALKKFKVDSPADFKTDDKKKEFFNYIDKNYKAKEEEKDIKEYIQSDGSRRKVKEGDQRRKENKLNEKDLDKNVDETLDRIREANVEKGRTMRNILADIWKMNEGKSPFEKEEGFSSDAQRKAAFASGYKEKGKNKKEELDDKDKETIKPIIKQLQKSVKAHDKQAKQLQKDIQDEVEITEAISDAQVAQIARMTDRNDHFGVRIEIARLMKDKQLMSFYDSLEKMHMTSQIQNAIGNDAVSLRGKLEKVLKVRMKQRFGDKDSKRIMNAL